MDKNTKTRNKKYDRVMPRVFNRFASSLKSSSFVTRHDTPSSVRLSAKPSVSNVSASVYSELPTVLNDYKPEPDREKPKRTFVVKPRKTLKSLEPALSPPRPAPRLAPRPQLSSKHSHNVRAETSAPSVLTRDPGKWSDTHVRQCYSSRTHSKLKELKDEIQMYQDTEKLMKLRSRLYKSCGVVLDDVGLPAADKAIQVQCPDEKKPDDMERRQIWLKIIHREELTNTPAIHVRVCHIHFTPDCLLHSSQRTRLKKTAIPTLMLPSSLERHDTGIQATQETAEKNTQTDQSSECMLSTEKNQSKNSLMKRKLQHEISEPKKIKFLDSTKAEGFVDLCDVFLNSKLAGIVKQQAKIRFHCRKRYSLEFKAFCLNLFYTSPQAYDICKSTMGLPSEIELNSMFLPSGTLVEKHLIDVLKIKVEQMTETEKNCSLVVSTASLKPSLYYNISEDKIHGFQDIDGVQTPDPAKFALVAMIQGLFDDYRQPVGFVLLAGHKNNLKESEWLDMLIKKLFNIGLNVRVLIGAGTSISVKKPYYYVGDKKIYYIVDPPNLMKLVRNTLLVNDFHFDHHVAKWDHIVEFYEKDRNKKKMRIADKLTESHLKPNDTEKLSVKYAVQVLSATVAKGLSTYRDFRAIASADGTIKLITILNDLFDFLNSSTQQGSTKFKNAFSGEEYQMEFMNEMLHFFISLKIIDPKSGQNVTSKIKFSEGFQLTIISIMQLFEDLKKEGHSYILTRRLNQDCLENFFESVKTQSRSATKPTAWQLIRAIRKMCWLDFFKPSEGKNREDNLTKMLLKSEEVFNGSESELLETGSNERSCVLAPIKTADYADLVFPKSNTLVYTIGYLLTKCLHRHKDCDLFKTYVTTDSDGGALVIPYYNNKSNSKAIRDVMLLPNDDFVKFVMSMEAKFKRFFTHKFSTSDVLKLLLVDVKKAPFPVPCNCFPIEYCKKLFLRMKLYHVLKNNNRSFRRYCTRPMEFSVT